jgi:osmotically-inducible protein OsmY
MRSGLLISAVAVCVCGTSAEAQSRSGGGFGGGSGGAGRSGQNGPGSSLASQNLLDTSNPASVSNSQLGQNNSQMSAFGSSSGSGIAAFGGNSANGGQAGQGSQRNSGRTGQQQRSSRGQFGQFGGNNMNQFNNRNLQQSARGVGVQQYVKPVIRIGFDPLPIDAAAVAQTANAAFAQAEALPGFQQINVSVSSAGVATLRGTADSDRQKKLAAIMLSLDPGVRKVENEISVRRTADAGGNGRLGF